jgi:nitrogen permease regulator 2-like protein
MLLATLYAEFDNEVGPRLLFQYPEGYVTDKTFETLSDFIILGKHLCEKIVVIKYENHQIVNFCVAIENSKVKSLYLTFID